MNPPEIYAQIEAAKIARQAEAHTAQTAVPDQLDTLNRHMDSLLMAIEIQFRMAESSAAQADRMERLTVTLVAQTNALIRLTRWLYVLTILLLVLALAQLALPFFFRP